MVKYNYFYIGYVYPLFTQHTIIILLRIIILGLIVTRSLSMIIHRCSHLLYAFPPQKVETWVPVKNGRIPLNAVANSTVNKKATYYCRVHYHGKTSYGVLVPKEGCYVEEPSVSMRFAKYDVLVSSIVG